MNFELLVPYKIDVPEREKNKKIFLEHYKDFNIKLIENYDRRSVAFNKAALESKAEYIALADIDAIIPLNQFVLEGDLIYPYDHVFNVYDYSIKNGFSKKGPWSNYYIFGLMVIFKRSEFLRIGGENENFIGWGWEDLERWFRALNHNLDTRRVPGPAYHLDHGHAHRHSNPFIEHNYRLMNIEREKYERKVFE